MNDFNPILQRVWGNGHGTRGVCIADNEPRYVTLEPVEPISSGIYHAERYYSQKFTRELFRLIDVEGHTNIAFHVGNTVEDTELCILLGMSFGHVNGKPGILDSLVAIIRFMKRLDGINNFTITVKDIP